MKLNVAGKNDDVTPVALKKRGNYTHHHLRLTASSARRRAGGVSGVDAAVIIGDAKHFR